MYIYYWTPKITYIGYKTEQIFQPFYRLLGEK